MSGNAGRSWVDGADEPHGFGLNHLPYGAFRLRGASGETFDTPHLCVRIGDWVLDLRACTEAGLLTALAPSVLDACLAPVLNPLLALGQDAWHELRVHMTSLLSEETRGATRTEVESFLLAIEETEMSLPVLVGDYTDFYASLDHARRVGEMFRPEAPLLPNYRHVPIAYHGRASSMVVSGTEIRRPWGQSRPAVDGGVPPFGPSAALDYEAELAFVVGTGNALGEPVPVGRARERIFGVALLNDWSARNVQSWEYQPLGPFLGKSFATSLSPWITPMAALEDFRVPARPRSNADPKPLEYLWDQDDQASGGLDVRVRVSLSTHASRKAGREPMALSSASTQALFWTAAQMVAHHTSNGCNLRSGDVLATGTVSGEASPSSGCLLEQTRNGAEPIVLANGERRAWLEDGDEVTLTARCERNGFRSIELGACHGRVGEAVSGGA